jgi:hypothetical protein
VKVDPEIGGGVPRNARVQGGRAAHNAETGRMLLGFADNYHSSSRPTTVAGLYSGAVGWLRPSRALPKIEVNLPYPNRGTSAELDPDRQLPCPGLLPVIKTRTPTAACSRTTAPAERS